MGGNVAGTDLFCSLYYFCSISFHGSLKGGVICVVKLEKAEEGRFSESVYHHVFHDAHRKFHFSFSPGYNLLLLGLSLSPE